MCGDHSNRTRELLRACPSSLARLPFTMVVWQRLHMKAGCVLGHRWRCLQGRLQGDPLDSWSRDTPDQHPYLVHVEVGQHRHGSVALVGCYAHPLLLLKQIFLILQVVVHCLLQSYRVSLDTAVKIVLICSLPIFQ